MWAYHVFTCLLLVWGAYGQLDPGRQLQYSFNIKTQLSPTEPENNYESSIFGKLTMRRYDEDTLEFRIDDIKTKIIRTSEKFKTTDSEAPGFDESLNLHFFANYGDDGKLTGIDTTHSEDFQSLTTMKAIASQFQIDEKAANLYDSTAKHYDSFEETVYGSCPCNYNIEPKDDNAFSLTKTMNCTDVGSPESYNFEEGHCQSGHYDSITISNIKMYEVVRKSYGWAIKSIIAKNEITILSEKVRNKILITQEYVLKNETECDYKFDQINELQNHQIKIDTISYDPNEMYHITKQEQIPEMLNTGLKQLISLLDQAEIKMPDLNTFNRNSLVEMLQTMRHMDFQSLKEYFASLQKQNMEETRKLFIGILPLVGTNDAMTFILNLVEKKEIKASFAGSLIQETTFHLKKPNMMTMDKLFELISMNASFKVTNSALMAYSTLLSDVIKFNPDNEKLQLKIDEFIAKMEKGDYDTQMLYLSALSNIRSPKVFGFLEKLVKKQTDFPMERPSHMRTMAMKAMLDQNIAEPEKMNNICWPILEDTNEDIELRAMAMEILMMNPSREDMTKIFTMMQTEKDDELYNYYFTMLESLPKIMSSCFQNTAEYAQEILALPRRSRPKYSASMAHYFDSIFQSIRLGAVMRFSAVGNLLKNRFIKFKFELSPQNDHRNINGDTIYIYARPMDIENDEFDTYVRSSWLFKYMQTIENFLLYKLLKVEIIVHRNNKIISVDTDVLHGFNEESGKPGILDYFIKQDEIMEYRIVEKFSGDKKILTDTGGVAVFSISTPIVTRTTYESSFNTLDDGKYKLYTDLFSHQTYGLKVFQPINSIWQGLRHHIPINVKIPIDLEYRINEEEVKAQFIINLSNDEKPYEFIAQAYIFKENFIDGPNIIQHCEWCKESLLQSMLQNEINLDMIIFEGGEKTGEFTDTTYKYESFDCGELINDTDKDYINKYLKTCGFKVSAKPNRTQLIIDMDGKIGESTQYTKPTIIFDPSWEGHMKITMMQKETELEEIDFHFKLNSSYSNTFNTSLVVLFDKPGEKSYYLTLDSKEKNMYTNMERMTLLRAGYEDEISVDFKMKAEVSNDIDSERDETVYQKCMDEEIEVRICTKEQTIFRKYIYEVTYVNITQIISYFKDFLSFFFVINESQIKSDGKLKVIVEYPLGKDLVNIEIEAPNENTNMTSQFEMRKFDFLTDSGHVGMLLPMTEFPFSMYERCQVNTKTGSNINGELIKHELGEDWVEYAQNRNKTFTILLKRIEDGQMAIRVENFDRIMEIHPKDGFEITIDEKKMEHDKYGYYRTEWFDFKVTEKRIFVHLKTRMSYFNFDGNTIDMSLLNAVVLKGKCFE